MNAYFVKTRNWNSNKFAHRFLMFLSKSIKGFNHTEGDMDIKYWIETTSFFKAWTVFLLCFLVKKQSGGWTYIVLPGHEIKNGCKAIN